MASPPSTGVGPSVVCAAPFENSKLVSIESGETVEFMMTNTRTTIDVAAARAPVRMPGDREPLRLLLRDATEPRTTAKAPITKPHTGIHPVKKAMMPSTSEVIASPCWPLGDGGGAYL